MQRMPPWLGVPSRYTYGPHPAPPSEEREIRWRAIVDQARGIGARVQDASEDEIDALIDEAFAAVRGRAPLTQERG
jgi:hypothetical protein